MDNFIFYNPTKLCFGKNTIQAIGSELAQRNYRKVLILAGGGSIKNNGVYSEAIESLKTNNIEWVELWGVRPNPELDHANKAIDICRKNNVDAILAIGGGSVIDEAKSIALGFYLDNLWDAFEGKVQPQKALPLFTILTISATGSEMNCGAVLSNEAEKKKWPVHSLLVYPAVSIIDPSKQTTLPWNQTVNGAIDALSHIMENYFAGSNQEATFAFDEALMKTIIKETNLLKTNPKDYDARANLAWSATAALNGMSGIGIRTGDWSSHMIEHGISALHPEIAHGAGLAIVYPAWIEYVQESNPDVFKRWSENVWHAESIEHAIGKMKDKYKSWSAPISLREVGITENEISQIAENATAIGNGYVGVIRKLSTVDVVNILKIAY